MVLKSFVFLLFICYCCVCLATTTTTMMPQQSTMCVSTEAKPMSCYYYVIRNDLNHEAAAKYCMDTFNGALASIYDKDDDIYQVMKKYFWWSDSNMDINRFRIGMVLEHDQPIAKATKFNPVDMFNKVVDKEIWHRSFHEEKTNVHFNATHRDLAFPKLDANPDIPGNDDATGQYISIGPKNLKWSPANYNRTIPFVCEVPRFPKMYCEPGWELHMKSRSCFFLNPNVLPFEGAAKECRFKGSNLASINDESENTLVENMISAASDITNGKEIWFGLRHDGRGVSESEINENRDSEEFRKLFVEKMGYNVDGTPVSTYHNFFYNQPDGVKAEISSLENCILIERDDTSAAYGPRKWNDYNCVNTQALSLCRKMASTQAYQKNE